MIETYSAKRARVERQARELMANTRSGVPMGKYKLDRLKALTDEMAELDHGVESEHQRAQYRAFCELLRYGRGKTSAESIRLLEESRDMGTGGAYPGSPIGYLVPMDFMGIVESAMKDYSSLLSLATTIDTPTGRYLPYPSDNDTTVSGELIPEQSQASEADVAGLEQTTLNAYIFSSKIVKISRELVQDQAVDFPEYLAKRFAVRINRAAAPYFTNGTGSGQPMGFITAASSAGVAAGSGTNDGTGGPGTIGVDDMTMLELSVDPAYRVNATWQMHPNTLAVLRRTKDKVGNNVFPGLHSGDGNTVFGYRVTTNPFMDQLQTQASSPQVTRKPIAFGDFSKFVIRRVQPTLIRMSERFADFYQYGYVLLWRQDSQLVDGGGGAIKYLETIL